MNNKHYKRGYENAKTDLLKCDHASLLKDWGNCSLNDDYDRGYKAALDEYAESATLLKAWENTSIKDTLDEHVEKALMEKHFLSVKFSYINHAGKIADREVVHPTMLWGNTEFYPEDQWLLHAFDLDKMAWRTFAFNNITIIKRE